MQSKRRWLKVSESDLQKEHLSSVMNPILNSLVLVNNIEFRTCTGRLSRKVQSLLCEAR